MIVDKKVLKLTDLLEDIKEVNQMIIIHSEDSHDKVSSFMLSQYIAKRDKLMSYLIDELLAPEMRSPRSFAIISKLLKNHYPNLQNEAKRDVSHNFLEKLELQLA
jgi:hypothetical protein